jgi:hypothetical protein
MVKIVFATWDAAPVLNQMMRSSPAAKSEMYGMLPLSIAIGFAVSLEGVICDHD